jgi:exopolysaccharide production protein ExoY
MHKFFMLTPDLLSSGARNRELANNTLKYLNELRCSFVTTKIVCQTIQKLSFPRVPFSLDFAPAECEIFDSIVVGGGGSLARRTGESVEFSSTAIPAASSDSTGRDPISPEEDARVIYLDDQPDGAHPTQSTVEQNERHRVINLDEAEAPAQPHDGRVDVRDDTGLAATDVLSPAPVLLTQGQLLALEEAIEDGVTDSVYTRFGKRLFDIALVVIAAPLWLPLYALIALVMLISQGRPIHYRQDRVGRGGRDFLIIKFRTMRSNADAELMEVLLRQPGLEEEYRSTVKLRSDPRVTAIGRFFRRCGIDELPQVWNVLAGDMSLVGPRPVRRGEWINCYGSHALHVFRVRPGMTGMWQTGRNSLTSYEERVYLDAIYAVRCSLATDLKILAATIPSLIGGDGSV